jgi:hypothetical protein
VLASTLLVLGSIYPEHRNLSGINKAGETKNLYVSDFYSLKTITVISIIDSLFQHRVVVVVRSVRNLPESPAISPMAYNTHNKYVLVAAKNKAISLSITAKVSFVNQKGAPEDGPFWRSNREPLL